jgi:hypothetical protein
MTGMVLGFFNAKIATTPRRQAENSFHALLAVIGSVTEPAATLRKNSPLCLASWRLGDLGV